MNVDGSDYLVKGYSNPVRGWVGTINGVDYDERLRAFRHRYRDNPELVEIIEVLVEILDRLTQPTPSPVRPPTSVRLFRLGGNVQLTLTQTGHYVLEEDDSQGKSVGSDIGTAVWTTGDPAIATVAAAADGYSADVTPVAAGSTDVTVHVTGTNPDGTPFDITGTDTIVVVGNDVAAAKITGTVVDNAPAAPPATPAA